jgi:hypothetical protein
MKPERLAIVAVLTLSIAAAAATAAAHHRQTGFDPNDKPIELKGTVSEYRWRNPHVLFFWEVTDSNGKSERWIAEFASVTTSISRGLTKDTFKIGEEVTVTCIRARAGGPICAQVRRLMKADGTLVTGTATD